MATKPTSPPIAPTAARKLNGNVAVGVLSYLGFTVLLLQVGIVPQLPAIGRQLHLSPGDVSWILTAELLAGAVALAVFSRLADLYGKRRIMAVCLGLALVGALLGALTKDVALLFVARALMGAQAPMLALPEALASDTMDPAKARTTITTIHAGNSVGVAGGLLLGALVGAEGRDYHLYLWVAVVTLGLGLLALLLLVRESPHRATGRIDVTGALLLAAGLVGVLLGTSKGPTWGWGSPQVLVLIVGGLVLLALWVQVQRRVAHPLVDLNLVRNTATRTPVIVVFLIAFGIYGAISAVARFSQTNPTAAGYGFGYTPVDGWLFSIPVAIGGLAAAALLQPLGKRIGFAGAAAVSVACCTVAYFVLALAHSSFSPMMVSLGVYALGNTMGLAASQVIVARSVPPSQSGVALGLTAIVYAVGNSLGTTMVGVFFSANTLPGGSIPAPSAYTLSFVVCGVCTLVAAVFAWRAHRLRIGSADLPA
ncbi:MFS transporter [Amycolatopsis rhabdoformis]|uniref:MFS transporter n=1 Tax=Amycolatopsis rhabdoformis TaxID=1448059 RepID=A0ABZ1IGE4_9PSEU|nr:MFS transporter [Amycolatopsis rhabdoformis]WSE33530.1 MFS transporter [Amycolatopsis rhabdoformis]